MSCGQEKQQLLDCTGGDGVNAKRQKDWEGIAEDMLSFNLMEVEDQQAAAASDTSATEAAKASTAEEAGKAASSL
ncbi:unnamed protein product [Sphagnum troendelagicum]|uniref:Uncharacterized protein n=1 Tax=Sphagnum jensenii TaxID=128206 RepID=A0ABP0X5T6_9BRYO